MTRSPLRFLLVSAAAAIWLSGCSLVEPGGPTAAKTVRAQSAFRVADVVERVFVDEGYTPILRSSDGTLFERPASKTDNVLYGDWIGGKITQRVKVSVTAKGADRYRVRCIPYVVRDPHDAAFEDQHRRFQVYSFAYGSLLREVDRQCRELWESQPGPEE